MNKSEFKIVRRGYRTAIKDQNWAKVENFEKVFKYLGVKHLPNFAFSNTGDKYKHQFNWVSNSVESQMILIRAGLFRF